MIAGPDSDPPDAYPPDAYLDEMVDGRGGVRPHWRGLIAAFGAMQAGGLEDAARRLDRAFEEEGVTAMLPRADDARSWRCDPIPLLLSAGEFAALEDGLTQRARLLEAMLADLYGAQTLLAEGVLPPALVFANPGFLRAGRAADRAPGQPLLHFYAADLIRLPDGNWRVLADRTDAASGVGYARENRRMMARVLPEAFRAGTVRQLRPFFETWQDALRRLAPDGQPNPSIALLTPGAGHPQWFEHMFLSRELSCALVEAADLTVRNGAVFLKTLRGLSPVDVLLRRVDGALIDPLETAPGGAFGVPGLVDAARSGSVRIANAPGTALAEAPALSAFLPALAAHLLREDLRLPSVPAKWMGDAAARAAVLADPAGWRLRPAMEGAAPGRTIAELPEAARRDMLDRVASRPWAYAASAAVAPSVAPSVGSGGMVPLPVVLRMFLVNEGDGTWRVMPGGLARVLAGAGDLPRNGLSKDVWALSEDSLDIVGPAVVATPPMLPRRTAGDLPSRAADNLYWLGRYVERLETAGRLIRATLARLTRGAPLPRELAEIRMLAACLADAGLVSPEVAVAPPGTAALPDALLRAVKDAGAVGALFAHVARLTDAVRDRLTGDMYAHVTQTLRVARSDAQRAGNSLDALAHACVGIVRFSVGVAGIAAENLVRGGGFLFLDLGRRIERAQASAASLANLLDVPPGRMESGLRLALELCDSVITYRSRYLTVLQAGPALDLVMADPGNPRALGFQLAAVTAHLRDVAGGDDALSGTAAAMQAEIDAMTGRVVHAGARQMEAAATLAAELREIEMRLGQLSDALTRRYFALLPASQTLGLGAGEMEPAADAA